MEYVKKYWPIAAGVVIAVLIVLVFLPNSDNTARKEFEKERKEWQEERKASEQRIENLRKDSTDLRKEMAVTKEYFAKRYKEQDDRYNKLKKQYDKINFSDYTVDQLDSIRRRLYPELYR